MDGNEIAIENLETGFEILKFIKNLIQSFEMEWEALERKNYSSTYDLIPDPFDVMDRLSDLPGEIIENNIFKHLTLQEQARTSVLSKLWMANWRTLSAPIQTFTFKMPKTIDSDQINKVHAILASRNVENLSLEGPNYTIPSQIFDLIHLTRLDLMRCRLTNPPTASFDGFPNLKKVALYGVKIRVDLNDLISRWCPVLAEFRICGCKNVRDLVIDARCLVVLEVDTKFRSILFRNAPALKCLRVSTMSELRLPRVDMPGPQHLSMFERILGSLPTLENVSFEFEFRLGLETRLDPVKLGFRMNAVRRIALHSQYMMCITDAAVALSLINSCPNLEELVIQFMYGWLRGAYTLDQLSEFITSHGDRSYEHLRTVTLHSFMGSQPEMDFVKILLAGASVLEDMHIFTDVNVSMSDVKVISEYTIASDELAVTVNGVPWDQVDFN
ncbi:F-box/FBD/LRR-repeat protein At1g13570 [Linum perenne]